MADTKVQPKDLNLQSPTPGEAVVYNGPNSPMTTAPLSDGNAKTQTVFLATNTGNDYVLTGTGITSYNEAQSVLFRVSQRNTGPVTMNIDGLGALPLVSVTGEILQANTLRENDTYTIRRESDINRLVVAGQANVNQATTGADFVGVLAQGATNYPIAGASGSESIVYDGNRFVYITNGVEGLVYKFDTQTNIIVAPNASVPLAWHYVSYDNGFLYVGQLGAGGNLMRKVDTNTMTTVATLTLTGARHTSCVESGFLYTCSSAGNVQKIDLSTFTIQPETNNLASGSLEISQIITDGSHLYAHSGGRVRKMNIGTLTTVLDYLTGVSLISVASIFSKGGFVYISAGNTTPMSIRKIDKTTMTLTAQTAFTRSAFGMADFNSDSILVVYDGFNGGNSNKIARININTMTEVGTPISLSSGPQEIVKVGSVYYVGNESAPVGLNVVNIENITPPAPGTLRLYFKTDGKLYRMDSNGNEQLIGTQT